MAEFTILSTENKLDDFEINLDKVSLQEALNNQIILRILEDRNKYSLFLTRYSKEIKIIKFFIGKVIEKLKRRKKINRAVFFEDNLNFLAKLLEDEATFKDIFDYEIFKLVGVKKIQYFLANFDIFLHFRSSYLCWNQKDHYSKHIVLNSSIKNLIEDYSEADIRIIKSLSLSPNEPTRLILLDEKIILYDNSQKKILSSSREIGLNKENCVLNRNLSRFVYFVKNNLFILNFADTQNITKQKIRFKEDIKLIYEPNRFLLSIFTESSIMIYSYEKNMTIASVGGLVKPLSCHFDLIQDNFILFYENTIVIKLLCLNEF